MQSKIETGTGGLSYFVSLGVGSLGLAFNEWIALGGFLFAAGTFIINWHYKKKHYELAIREQERLDRLADN